MGTLVASVAGLGLAVAFTSPTSVVTVIVLLSMPSGRRRAIAFLGGWLIAIAAIGAIMVFVLQGQDFASRTSTPSRAASALEVLLGSLLLIWAVIAFRRRAPSSGGQSTPKWLARIQETHWLIAAAVGAIMLSYGLSLAAASEILKANVGRFDAGVALAVFAVTLKQRSPKARRPRRALRARGTSPRWRPASPSGRAENGGLAAPPSRAEQT